MNVTTNRKREDGFTLIELLTVLTVMGIMVAMSVMLATTPLNSFKANSGMNFVTGELRAARAMAIAQRRDVQVTFGQTVFSWGTQNYIQLHRLNLPVGSAATDFPPDYAPTQTQFVLISGVPDTPMGFGLPAGTPAIYFGGLTGGPPVMKFTSRGTFEDGTNKPINGTIFLGLSGGPAISARAVTILGATGRIRPYHYNGSWAE